MKTPMKNLKAFLQHGGAGKPMRTEEVEVRKDDGPLHDSVCRSCYWVRGRGNASLRWQRVRFAKRLGRHYVRLHVDGVRERTWVTIHDGDQVIL